MLSCEQHVADCDIPAPISSRVCDIADLFCDSNVIEIS